MKLPLSSKAVSRVSVLVFLIVALLLVSDNTPQISTKAQVGRPGPAEVQYISIQYYPIDPDRPGYLDPEEVGLSLDNNTLDWVDSEVDRITLQTAEDLSEGTRYRNYNNPGSQPYLTYRQFGDE